MRSIKIRNKKWNEGHIERLKELYHQNTGVQDIAEILNRTFHSVWAKIQNLGLKKSIKEESQPLEERALRFLDKKSRTIVDLSNYLDVSLNSTKELLERLSQKGYNV